MPTCQCIVENCNNTNSILPKVSYFKFPKDPERAKTWGKIINREDIVSHDITYYICEKHFEERFIGGKLRKTLHANAVPTLHLAPEKTVQVETRENLENDLLTFVSLCDDYLMSDVAQHAKVVANLNFEAHARRLDSNKLEYDISISDELPYGFKKERLLAILKMKVDCLREHEKLCSVLVRRVPVKPHLFYSKEQDKLYGFHELNEQQSTQLAKYAIIVMVRGINKDWHMPADIALVSEKNHPDIAAWFETILTELFNMGLNVKVCISSLSPDLLISSDVSLVTVFLPFFIHNKKRIFYMHNPDYLTLKIRSLLMNFQLKFQGLMTNWEHVLQLYENDSKKNNKLIPEFSVAAPMDQKEIQATLRKGVLSEKVAAGLSAYVDFRRMDESARGTVKFISVMSKFIDCMRSLNVSGKTKNKNKATFETNKNLLESVLCLFHDLRVFKNGQDVTSNVLLIRQFLITLRSINFLIDEVAELPLKYLRMDVLNNFLMRMKKRNRGRPFTSIGLIKAMRKNLLNQAMKPLVSSKVSKKNVCESITIGSDYRNIVLPKKHQFMYVCGYVLKNIYEKHKCADMVKYTTFNEPDETNFSIYKEFKEICSEELPMIPRDSLIVFLQKFEAALQMFLKSDLFENRGTRYLFARIMARTKSISFQAPCSCFPEFLLRELYIRLRLFHIISMNNKDNKGNNTNPLNKPTFKNKYLI